MKTMRTVAIGLGLLLVLAACGANGGAGAAMDAAGSSESAGGFSRDMVAERSAVTSAGEEQPAEEMDAAAEGMALGGGSSGGSAPAAAPVPADGSTTEGDVDAPKLEPLPESSLQGQRIIKEGSVTIEVPKGDFDEAFQGVVTDARKLGGDVVGSSTRTSDTGETFGSVTVRVPVEDFEDLLVDLRGIGTITNRDITSQDVSAEFTDLESRLRHLEALERFYLGLFDDAKNVSDAITVQQRLADVQGQIEKAQGRLNLLDDRTSFSTLTVEIIEPGAAATPPDPEPGSERPTIAQYWETARDAFVNVVGAMLVALLFVLPLLVPLALLVIAALAYRRSRRIPVAAPAPAQEPEAERETVDA